MGATIQAVIFDLDGVLINSGDYHIAAYLAALKPFGITAIDYRTISGMGTPEAMRTLLAAAQIQFSEDQVRNLVSEKQRIYAERIKVGQAVTHGAPEVIARLAQRMPVGLGTSGSRGAVERFLEASRCRHYFSGVVCADDVSRTKPDPEIFLRCAKLLGKVPGECLVIEDSDQGLTAASRGGFSALAFRNPDTTVINAGHITNLREIESYL